MRRPNEIRRVIRVAVLASALLAWAAALAAASLAQAASQPATAPSPDQSRPQLTQKMSFLELLMRGGVFMIPIGVCSLLGLAVVIERMIALRRRAVVPQGFLDGLRASFSPGSGETAAGLAYCRARDCPIGRMLQAGLRKLGKSHSVAEVEKALEDAGAGEIARLRRNLMLLQAVVAVSPMLGLLGTVWGMILAFQVASDPNVDVIHRGPLLGKGIYEALVTTLAGLMVAIPVLFFYYYFRGKIDTHIHEMNDVASQFTECYAAADERKGPDHANP